ncbi:hypothetical protein Pint_30428 [Pistacia integerrima]|uniref:Uncharacterized protein n=1 Tax=Pistacia integerrima TaxID=434235 RepID=A0ACC0X088_9ROSI|nr:hypothetical protein Pint_30428 [Pistacia integerrima]
MIICKLSDLDFTVILSNDSISLLSPHHSVHGMQDLLSKSLLKSMYVSFLAGCFRSIRFGLEEAHGKGQALQFNWLFEKEAFILHSDDTFSVDFAKVEGAVESLSREILTIQARGDKEAASLLLQKYCKMTKPLTVALQKLEDIQVVGLFKESWANNLLIDKIRLLSRRGTDLLYSKSPSKLQAVTTRISPFDISLLQLSQPLERNAREKGPKGRFKGS